MKKRWTNKGPQRPPPLKCRGCAFFPLPLEGLSSLGTDRAPSWGSRSLHCSPAPASGPECPHLENEKSHSGLLLELLRALRGQDPLPQRPAPANPGTSLAGFVPMGLCPLWSRRERLDC